MHLELITQYVCMQHIVAHAGRTLEIVLPVPSQGGAQVVRVLRDPLGIFLPPSISLKPFLKGTIA